MPLMEQFNYNPQWSGEEWTRLLGQPCLDTGFVVYQQILICMGP